jgi:16S rRNA (cytosine1402-N4)-methyltransferase
MSYEEIHKPVLLKEVLYYLNLKKGDIVFEGTLGGAGHTIEIIEAIAPTGKIIGVDLDSKAISTATIRLKKFLSNLFLINDSFANISGILRGLEIKSINGFFLDLGLSSSQIENSGRGFSYMRNEKLDMRFNPRSELDACDVVNNYTEKKLKEIIYKHGEERWSSRISKNIVSHRSLKKITHTGELVEIIKKSIPAQYRSRRKGHPAKRVFQALRIEVNRELDNLDKALEDGFELLKSCGRMVIISYHSLEDRIVKRKFRKFSGKCICPSDLPVCKCGAEKKAKIITKKVVKPSLDEIRENPRSRSARLRVLEKL